MLYALSADNRGSGILKPPCLTLGTVPGVGTMKGLIEEALREEFSLAQFGGGEDQHQLSENPRP